MLWWRQFIDCHLCSVKRRIVTDNGHNRKSISDSWDLRTTMNLRGITSRTFDSWTQYCSSPSVDWGRQTSTIEVTWKFSRVNLMWIIRLQRGLKNDLWHASVYAFEPCIIMYTSNITTYWDPARNKMALLCVMKQKSVHQHLSVLFSNSTERLFWINDRIINNTESVRLVTLGCKRPLRPVKEIADFLSLPPVGGLPVSFLLVISFLR